MASFFNFARGSFPAALFARGPSARQAPSVDTRSPADLAALINGEVIPRMVALTLPPVATPNMASHNPVVSDRDVEDFVPLALQEETDALLDRVEGLMARGVTAETLLVELLAPAARRLGDYWEQDRVDFLEVTMGMWRLQELVHEIAARGAHRRHADPMARRALIATMPGEQHGFGAIVLAQIFESHGWQTDRLGDVATSDLAACLARDSYDLLGLTVSCDFHIGPLPSVIRSLRSVSKNPRLQVMVGGPAIAANPGCADAVGADATAADAVTAVAVATALVDAAYACEHDHG